MKKKLSIICVSLIVLGLGTLVARSQQVIEGDEIKEDAKGFMAQKLGHSKQVVSGLALENFDAIEQSADKLIQISYESNWKTFQSEEYLDLSEEFRGSASRLKKAAREKNLDGSTLAYFEVTMNCVRCHKYVRKLQHPHSLEKKEE
jgi:hypothetical protein